MMQMPLISCIMPTADREEFIPFALACFRAKTYPFLELVVVDDGQNKVDRLLSKEIGVNYHTCSKMDIGAKRNLCCELALGEIIAHWDDDDYYASERIAEQYRNMKLAEKPVCGFHTIEFCDETDKAKWLYLGNRDFAIGTSLMYLKAYWRNHQFKTIRRSGEDNIFVQVAARERISLREAALALNEITPPGATIVVTRSAGLFAEYARPDLVVDKTINSILNLNEGYDFCVQLGRGRNWDIYPDAKIVNVIEREGAVLASVKDMRKASGAK